MRKGVAMQKNNSESRNYSLDLLRIVCMLMIVFMHMQTHGGIEQLWCNTQYISLIMRWMTIVSSCAVNIFVMISGYYLSNQGVKLTSLVKTIIQVLFYSWTICVVLLFTKRLNPSSEDLIKSICPISFRKYWFATSYVGLCLISPFINNSLKFMNKRQHCSLIVLLLIMMSVVSDIIPGSSAFNVDSGYSIVWFVVLYIISSYIRKYVDLEKVSRKRLVRVFFICSIFILFSTKILASLIERYSFLSRVLFDTYYCRYNSILIVIESCCLFLIFLKIKVIKKWEIGCISFFAPLSFGVYLISDNNPLRDIIWKFVRYFGAFDISIAMIPIKSLLFVFVVYVLCALVDKVRMALFIYLYQIKPVKELLVWLDDKWNSIFGTMSK